MTTALVPLDQMQTMAAACAKSGLFGAKTPEQALTIMLLAQAEGRHPMSAAKDYNIIKGKPAKTADAMLRYFLAAGGSVVWHKYEDDGAEGTFSHPQGGSVKVDWNHKRMVQAQIENDAMYKKYPRSMYRARCITEGVRTVYPGATGGLYAPEEVRTFAEKNMGKAEVVQDEVLYATPEQIEAMKAALKESGIEVAALLAKAEINDLAEMPSADCANAIKWIRKQKAA